MEAAQDPFPVFLQRSQETSANFELYRTLHAVELTLELPAMLSIQRKKRHRMRLSPLRETRALETVVERGRETVQQARQSLLHSPLHTGRRSHSRKIPVKVHSKLPSLPLRSHTNRSQSVQKSPLEKTSFSLQKQEAQRVMYFFPSTVWKETQGSMS